MNAEHAMSIAAVLLYRCAILGSGTFAIWLGYKLFRAGVLDRAAKDLKMIFGSYKLMFKSAAPGTVFAAFGAIIVSVAVCNPPVMEFTQKTESSSTSATDMTGPNTNAMPTEAPASHSSAMPALPVALSVVPSENKVPSAEENTSNDGLSAKTAKSSSTTMTHLVPARPIYAEPKKTSTSIRDNVKWIVKPWKPSRPPNDLYLYRRPPVRAPFGVVMN